MTRRLLSVALVLPALIVEASTSVAPQKNWKQLTTANFRVIGNAGEGDLRRAATRLEQFREAFGILFPKVVLVSSAPTTVIVFRGDKEYDPFKPLYKGKPKEISGFFLPGSTANYVTMTAAGVDQFGVIYHEYVHLLVNNTVEGLPLWFNEGLADYYGTFEVTGGGRQAIVGRIRTDHVLRLREQWLPLATLVTVDRDSPSYNEADKMSVFYAESWALVHYLVLGRDGRYAKGLNAFLGALADGKDLDHACTTSLGITPVALERELRQYVQRDSFPSQLVSFTNRIGAVEQLPVTPLDPARAHATLGDLLFRMQRLEEARGQVDRALALVPALPEAHAVLGRLLFAGNEKDQALAHLEQAAAVSDAPWNAHFEYAALLIDGRTAGAVSPALDAATERALRRTIELQPSFPDAYALLAFMRSLTPEGLSDAANLLQRAVTLAPGNTRYWLMLAHVFDARSDAANARRIAERLAAVATDTDVRDEAAELLARLDAAARRDTDSPVKRAADDGGPQNAGAMPSLRKPGTAERRLAGTLTSIECESGSPVFVVRSGESEARIGAAEFAAVEFISHRADAQGQVTCGAQRGLVIVLTYKPGGGGRSPIAVAVEFLPDGWVPR